MTVALFVDPHGVYPRMLGRDACWDAARDARTYPGDAPVVAHPPCHLWVNFAALNYKRWGGDHNRPGNDGGCFASALASVRRWGGVLEHPANSRAWVAYDLPEPEGNRWVKRRGVWVCEVWQSAYGHKARKRTWLLYSGRCAPYALRWDRKPGTHQVGHFDRIKPVLGKREASASPEMFARELIHLAEWSR